MELVAYIPFQNTIFVLEWSLFLTAVCTIITIYFRKEIIDLLNKIEVKE